MLFLAALFFIFAVAAARDELERECRSRVLETCVEGKVSVEIPETMEDLRRDCRLVQDALKCTLDENENCKVKAFDTENMKKLDQFLKTNCDEDSPLYQALNQNYECIQPGLEIVGNECRLSEENTDRLDDLVDSSTELSLTAKLCIAPLIDITCFAVNIGKECGQEAKETVTEIAQNINWNFRNCNNEGILRELEPMRNVIESMLTEANEVRDSILDELKDVLEE